MNINFITQKVFSLLLIYFIIGSLVSVNFPIFLKTS